jgi:hypothetical protein
MNLKFRRNKTANFPELYAMRTFPNLLNRSSEVLLVLDMDDI